MDKIICPTCKNEFEKDRKSMIYCSEKCRPSYSKYKRKNTLIKKGISKPNIGAISESLIVIDLLKHGYRIFRPISSDSVCDMIALKNDKTIKIEVKTGHRSSDKKLVYSNPTKNQKFDLLAIAIINPFEIIYMNDKLEEIKPPHYDYKIIEKVCNKDLNQQSG